MGIATSRAIGCHARRNRQRRRIREAVRAMDATARQGLDIVISAKESVQDIRQADLIAELETGITEMRKRWDENSES